MWTNIRAVYGTTADDLENPVITSVRGGGSSITGYSDLTELAEGRLHRPDGQ